MVDKLLQRRDGENVQYVPIVTSAGAADSGKIPALGADGKLDPSVYTAGSSEQVRSVPFSEAVSAGRFINLYSNAGTLNARLADNSNARPAHGFVRAAVSSGASGNVYPLDAINGQLTGLTPGTRYFLGTAGAVITPALDPTAAGNAGFIDQKIGLALSATELQTDDYDYVIL